MPRRVQRYRVDATAVQGNDAYVDIQPLSWPEMRAALQLQEEAQNARKQGEEVSYDAGKIREMLTANLGHILGWNWVDYDGAPLPQPKDDPSVIDQLNTHEIQFLARILSGGEGVAQKN